MVVRDLKAAAVGSALTLVVLLIAHWGKSALSHSGDDAPKDGEPGRTVSSAASRTAPATDDRDPAMAANANLVDQMRSYRQQLETIAAQKVAIEKQLAEVRRAPASDASGQGAHKSEYDLSPEDWKQLAAEGVVKVQIPCDNSDTYDVSPTALAGVGLPPSDAQPIHDALRDSSWRLWRVVRALCAQGLQGSLQRADEMGPEACRGLIQHLGHLNGGDLADQVRVAADIEAGLVPMPDGLGTLGIYTQLLLAESAESQSIVQQLTNSIGPDDARAFVYGGAGCWERTTRTVGPRSTGTL
jgi:hypothetical protein